MTHSCKVVQSSSSDSASDEQYMYMIHVCTCTMQIHERVGSEEETYTRNIINCRQGLMHVAWVHDDHVNMKAIRMMS